jgi:hypothetical protein
MLRQIGEQYASRGTSQDLRPSALSARGSRLLLRQDAPVTRLLEKNMGRAKEELIAREEKVVQTAVGLCAQIGALEECPLHSDVYVNTLAYLDADQLAEEIAQDINGSAEMFDSKQDMADCIRDALELAEEECPICAKNMDS